MPPKPEPMPTVSNEAWSGATTPGRMRMSSVGLRPMIDMFSICSLVIRPSRAPVWVWITARSAVTSTVSPTVPISSLTSTPTVSFELTRRPLVSYVLKPASATLRLYVPGSTAAKKKPPVALVTMSREKRVPSLASVTVAPGTTAPDVSVTVPRKLPALWANALVASAATASARPSLLISLFNMAAATSNGESRGGFGTGPPAAVWEIVEITIAVSTLGKVPPLRMKRAR